MDLPTYPKPTRCEALAEAKALARPPLGGGWTPRSRLDAIAWRAAALGDLLEDQGDLALARVADNVAGELLRISRGDFGRLP